MTEYQIKKTTSYDNVADLRLQYFQRQVAPLDGMWQTFVSMADIYTIICADRAVGYCAINAEQKLLQFHLEDGHNSRELFGQSLEKLSVAGAVVSTCEGEYVSLCMDRQASVRVHAFMYEITKDRPTQSAEFSPEAEFRLVVEDELQRAVEFGVSALGANRDWLTGYYAGLIEGEELFGLWLDGALIGAGECRPSKTQRSYADVGMVVGPDHRGQGLATGILRRLVHCCADKGLIAICSTERDNIAAQKAITKAGFVGRHRILDVQF